jgi:hypothetical protein
VTIVIEVKYGTESLLFISVSPWRLQLVVQYVVICTIWSRGICEELQEKWVCFDGRLRGDVME